jgi:molecular chaperone GrpE
MNEENKSPEAESVDEAHIEENAAEGGAPGAESAPLSNDDLHLMLEDTRTKADEHWNQVLRLQAELDNTGRRARRDIENAHKFALDKFAQDLLPVKDSLELGLAAVNNEEAEAVVKLREGTELTLKMFSDVMERFGIKELNPEGESFNPELHQAMSIQESSEVPPNSVIAVMQKGYTLNGRLVRPAMVMVSKAVTETTQPSIDEQA